MSDFIDGVDVDVDVVKPLELLICVCNDNKRSIDDNDANAAVEERLRPTTWPND